MITNTSAKDIGHLIARKRRGNVKISDRNTEAPVLLPTFIWSGCRSFESWLSEYAMNRVRKCDVMNILFLEYFNFDLKF